MRQILSFINGSIIFLMVMVICLCPNGQSGTVSEWGVNVKDTENQFYAWRLP